MTARLGGAYGRGYTSGGESIVELPSEARLRAQKERVRNMARDNAAKKAADAFSATPGARGPGVKTVEKPLRIAGPRDALIEDGHNEGDYIPDVESKGYHTGVVRQPAKLAVNEAGQAVGFVSEHPSKFADQPNITDLKAHHNEVESGDDWNEDVREAVSVSAPAPSASMYDAPKATRATKAKAAKADAGDATVGDELREAADKG